MVCPEKDCIELLFSQHDYEMHIRYEHVGDGSVSTKTVDDGLYKEQNGCRCYGEHAKERSHRFLS